MKGTRRGTGEKRKKDPRSNRREITRLIEKSIGSLRSSTMRERAVMSLMAGGMMMEGRKRVVDLVVYLTRTHYARMMPAPRRPLAFSAAAEAVCRRPSSAPSSGTTPAAPCWCSPCARWPCNRDIGHPGDYGRAAPDRTRRTAWSCGTCTRAKCARPRTRGSSCESNHPCSRGTSRKSTCACYLAIVLLSSFITCSCGKSAVN